ncbi:hypothetical protein J6590_017143 [Homalodisca vitripennis]|nr:hypothetical protein J6590_017143 [Homalodisca vitripennis]
MYISKYNRFVDKILERINKILRRSYDPVNVKLQNASDVKKTKNKNKGKNTNKRRRPAATNKQADMELPKSDKETITTEAATEKGMTNDIHQSNNTNAQSRATQKKPNTKNKGQTRQKPKNRARAKATLYGLSTIKRDGNVTVNMMSSHTTIKTRFLVGPLMLKVEKQFGRGAKKELRSATATTAEMTGRMTLRVVQGGAATLQAIRVLQPKQVRVDSTDDHDRTREFVWRRSSTIAHLVSQKLLTATRSMLKPPPNQQQARTSL